jgi:hypothetical protein
MAIVLKVMGWCDQSRSDFGKVKSEALRAVKEAFDRERIKLAEPVQNYRELREPVAEPNASPGRKPTPEELQAITDTSVDRAIDEKVRERRDQADNDLLTTGAPRE